MERTPQPSGGHDLPPAELIGFEASSTQEVGSWDQRVINEGIEAAAREGRSIDHRTARYIAGQLHGGQASGLYALASTGVINDHTMSELVAERVVQTPAIQAWIDALIAYCTSRPDPGSITDWVEQAEAGDRADVLVQIAAGSVARLGDVATVDEPDIDEHELDTFSWGDAARWSPQDADGAEIGLLSDAELNVLFSADTDEEIGAEDELAWHGLIRAEDRSGGRIVTLRGNDTHEVREFVTDGALTEAWTRLTSEYESYYTERDAYNNATLEAGDSYRGIGPQIWVGSLADYNAGYLHGDWFDATCDAEDLELATRFMLRGSHIPNAEEWAVMDYDGFGQLHLGEYASFETINRIAAGISEYGQAFAAWAAHVGPENHDALDRFEDHYCGEWESFQAYIEDYLQESDFYSFLEHVPEGMRGYVEIDVDQIARDWGCDYEVAERPEGGVWVFEARM